MMLAKEQLLKDIEDISVIPKEEIKKIKSYSVEGGDADSK
jgi:hypothetical protein